MQTANFEKESTTVTLGITASPGLTHTAHSLNVTITDPNNGQLITDSVRAVIELVNYCILTGMIGFLGSCANLINISVFCRQKFSDSVNVSLLGLAVSDLGVLLTMIWTTIAFNPLFQRTVTAFEPVNIEYLTAGWPYVCFARITGCITAYATFERCLCVTLPLKVKTIITPKRTAVVICLIFVAMFAAVSPVFWAIRFGPVLLENSGTHGRSDADNRNSSRNGTFVLNISGSSGFNQQKTIISLVYMKNGASLQNISFTICVAAQISSFIIVIICTSFLVRSLVKTSRWRKSNASVARDPGEADVTISEKERRVIKRVTAVSTIFIVCYLPTAINLMAMINVAGYSITGTYKNFFLSVWSFLKILEGTNSSVNIIIYYKMSFRYRQTFRKMFGFGDENKNTCASSK